MAELLPKVRRYSDAHFKVTLSDSDVPISWDSVTIQRLFMYSERQKSFGGKASFQVGADPHELLVTWHAYSQQFLGVHRVVIQVELAGGVATYDAQACNVVASTSQDTDIEAEDIDVAIEVSEVDTTIMHEILAACQEATAEAQEAAAAAAEAIEHLRGGSTGQVLKKISDDDLDFDWDDAGSASLVQEEGQGTDAAMSQKAVTDSLNGIRQQRQMILTVHSNDPVVITDITQCEYAMIVISDELDSYTAKILPVCTMGEYFLYEYSENWRVVNEDIDHFFVEIAAAATYADLLAWLDDHSSQIASAADVSEKYTMPSTGIPVTDLAPGVQTSLGKADSAYQKPSSGIPATDLASGVQTSLGKVTELEQEVGGMDEALAMILTSLNARVTSIEQGLLNGLKKLVVDNLEIRNKFNQFVSEGNSYLRAAGVPAVATIPENWDADEYGPWVGTAQYIGQRYLNTSTGKWYTAKGTEAVSDWVMDSN